MTPKDTGSTIARQVYISHDADARADVVPRHGGKPGAGRSAKYADSTLTVDATAIPAAVTPEDSGRIARRRYSQDADARAGVCALHGGRPRKRRSAEYTDFTITVDADSSALTNDTAAVIGFAKYADSTLTNDTAAFSGTRCPEYASVSTLAPDTCAVDAGVLPVHGVRPRDRGLAEYAGATLAKNTQASCAGAVRKAMYTDVDAMGKNSTEPIKALPQNIRTILSGG